MKKKNLIKQFVLTSLLVGIVFPASAQFDNVGSIDFPTSESGEAQQYFLRGVAILHSFGWEQAQEQFQRAQEIAPDFAMAYWGESLAYNHPLFSQMDATEPRSVLQRLGSTPQIRMSKAPTNREKGFLAAVEILWGDGEIADRKIGYMEAMEDLYNSHPDDDEVAAFYALSVLSARAASGGDLDNRMAVKAGTIALDIFNRKPSHPGAAHYTSTLLMIQFMRHSLLRLLIAIPKLHQRFLMRDTCRLTYSFSTGCGTLYPEITNRPLTPQGSFGGQVRAWAMPFIRWTGVSTEICKRVTMKRLAFG